MAEKFRKTSVGKAGTRLIQSGAVVLLVLIAAAFTLNSNGNDKMTERDGNPIDQRVEELLAGMSLEDKVGEMTQLNIDMLCVGQPYNLEVPNRLDSAKVKKALVDLRVGSILNCGGYAYTREEWHNIIGVIQHYATKEKASGIPVLYGIDAIHGTNYTRESTLFPQQISLAATWDPVFAQQLGEVTAYETKASGIPWNFSPVLDIGRDPRWPRFWETFGEDVLLAKEMGVSVIKGYQGNDPAAPNNVAACMKHFLGYSMPLTGKDRTQSWLPERIRREYVQPTFQAAIDAGAKTVMINSGELNGVPVHISQEILVDLLRDEMGFTGLAVTDWEDIKYLYSRHKVAPDYKSAIKMAINAGIDMSMVPVDLDFPVLLKELVEEGEVPMSRIDEAVSRILRLKIELGLFEQPVPVASAYPDFGAEKHRQASYNAAAESIVLLKNDAVLPLNLSSQKVLVTGPTANSLNCLNGGWTHTWQGTEEKYNTSGKQHLADALQAANPSNVLFAQGCSIDKGTDEMLQEAVDKAKEADVIVLCLGETPYTEKPGDIRTLNLPGAQLKLAKRLATTGKPIVLVLIEGRPRLVTAVEPLVDAVVYAGLPGNEGGLAIRDVLTGKVNPSGKLPFTYPKFANDLLTYDHKHTDRIDIKFGLEAFQPQWRFGYGLSYSSFEYSNLKLSASEMGPKDILNISVDVKNNSGRDGKEVIQLYISDEVATITPPVERLRGFEKVAIAAGDTYTATFQIPASDLAFVGHDNQWMIEEGYFTLRIGELEERFHLKEGATFRGKR